MTTAQAPTDALGVLTEYVMGANVEYASTARILLCRLFVWNRQLDYRIAQHVTADRSIDFDEILDEGWSTGERGLIELAAVLWRGHGEWDPTDLCLIDPDLSRLALDAIALRVGAR